MENKVGKFFEKLKPLASMNNTMKIHPVFVEENQRIIERNLIIHSHQTFSNEIEKNYHKNYMEYFTNFSNIFFFDSFVHYYLI